jgi:hypothetical protein
MGGLLKTKNLFIDFPQIFFEMAIILFSKKSYDKNQGYNYMKKYNN